MNKGERREFKGKEREMEEERGIRINEGMEEKKI